MQRLEERKFIEKNNNCRINKERLKKKNRKKEIKSVQKKEGIEEKVSIKS